MASSVFPETDYQRQQRLSRESVQGAPEVRIPPTPSSVAVPVASPRTVPDAAAAYLNPPAPASVRPPAPSRTVQTAPPSVSGQFSPRTVNDQTAAYLAPPPVAAQPSAVAMDVADAYQRGAAHSPGTGVGMAMNEAIVSPVSRAMEAMTNAPRVGILRENIRSIGRGLSEVGSGIRAFITGGPPQPAASAPAPVAAPAPVVPSVRAPVTVDNATGAVVPAAAAQAPATPAQAAPAPAVPAAGVPSVRGSQVPVVVAPQPITAVPGTGGRGASSTLGAAFGTAAGLASVRGANNTQQRAFKNQLKALDANLTIAKTGSQLRRDEADIGRTGAEAEKTAEETKRVKAENQRREDIAALEKKLIDEKDPKARREIERKLRVLQGKSLDRSQVVMVKTTNPSTGEVTEQPYILDSETGQARPAIPPAPLAQNPQAVAIRDNPSLSREEKVRQLKALGY